MVFRYLVVLKCEAVSPSIEMEVTSGADQDETSMAKRPRLETDTEVKNEPSGIILQPKQEKGVESCTGKYGAGILLKPKQEVVAKSAAQIVHEQHRK